MEEKRQRGEDIGEVPQIPHDVMERIGQQADPSTQARLGVAMGTQGESLRLGARQRRADKAATVLQSLVRKHPIVNEEKMHRRRPGEEEQGYITLRMLEAPFWK